MLYYSSTVTDFFEVGEQQECRGESVGELSHLVNTPFSASTHPPPNTHASLSITVRTLTDIKHSPLVEGAETPDGFINIELNSSLFI